MTELTATEWDGFLGFHPDAHLLQTASWGELKASFGWQVVRLAVERGSSEQVGAQVLFRRLPFGFSLAYIAPRVGVAAPAGGRRVSRAAPRDKAR